MAKSAKKSKKPAAKPATKSAKKPARKPAPKASKKPAARSSAAAKPGPFKVSTGSGLAPVAIGADLVAMFNRGEFGKIEDKYWAPAIESIEGVGMNMGWRGRKAVEEKNQGWMSTHRIHGASAEGPFAGSTGFAVRFKMDVEDTTTGQRQMMDEVGVYTVQNGKIIREEFMYAAH
jgi:hypothetical protein